MGQRLFVVVENGEVCKTFAVEPIAGAVSEASRLLESGDETQSES